MWERVKPGRVVVAVFIAELIGLWAVAGLRFFYDLTVDPVDMRLNMLFFTTAAGWWTEYVGRVNVGQ